MPSSTPNPALAAAPPVLDSTLDSPPACMDPGNHSGAAQFLLRGLSDDPALQPLLFGLFLAMYLAAVLGNLLLILAVGADPRLHTPILAVMAYDRFVAICHPLHYMVIMSPRLCGLLVLMCWFTILWVSLVHILLIMQMKFPIGTEIPHFFCELAQILKVACSDTFINNICLYVFTALLVVVPAAGILCSYSQIAASLVKMSSSTSKHRAFSTCGSHLCVVSLFYGTGLGVYLSSAATQSSEESSVASVMYTVVTPMLNPFIYSLRNRDVKGALGKLLSRAASRPLWVSGLSS
ncbi:PREDICTED: olfactory receptor 7D4-like [Condylura cristata]|uniref:olfactory receptor 7D4-like n=1 Tax=Condylura cristata TaxID=143302 RepID=UPI000642E6DB|nr:PREDICTED: olfactory receptor 7D4-like [Condylura cristata]